MTPDHISHKFRYPINPLFIGVTLLLIPLYCYIGAEIGFILGFGIGRLLFPICVVASVATAGLSFNDRSKLTSSLLLSLAILIFSVIIMIFLHDSSGDGMIYHQEIIIHLVNGWNPFREISVPSPDPDIELLVVHYAKGIETMAAVVVKFTGLIESGKAVNLLIVTGSWFVIYAFFKQIGLFSTRGMNFVFATLLILNPIGLSQISTYCNDFPGYYYIILTIAIFGYKPFRFDLRQALALSGIIAMSVATKFTAFFYEGITIFAVVVWYAFHKNSRLSVKISLIAFIGVIVSVFALSYHPYVTNYLIAGHPCYPLMGENPLDIMTGNTPPEFLHRDRFTNFFSSLFSVSMPANGARKAGFGVVMGPVLIISIIAIIAGIRKRKTPAVYVYIASWALAACFFFDQSWWARYIPFLWIVPCIGAFSAFKLGHKWKIAGKLIVIASIISAMLFLAVATFLSIQLFGARYYANKFIDNNIAIIDSSIRTIESDNDTTIISRGVLCVERHLNESGISTKNVDDYGPDDQSTYISLSFYADNPSRVSVFFDKDRQDEIQECFTNSIQAKILRLHNFIPDTKSQY